jgi:hypothetical protein
MKGTRMKKFLISVFGLVVLAGCSASYDYYKGGVKYTQDGDDCVYRADERGREFSDEVRDMDKNQKVIYRNTLCADLFKKDTAGRYRQERQVLKSAPAPVACKSCACNRGCAQGVPVIKRRYVIVSGM